MLRPATLVLAILVGIPAVAADGPDANTYIQPGSEVLTPVGGCTLNFVWKDAANTYVGTAGHCAEGTGGRVSTPGHGAWGSIVLDIDGDTDFALIRVDAAKVPMVRAAVQHWGGPTGVATAAETRAGDVLALYGYGVGFSVNEVTRAKQGVLVSDNAAQYEADTWAVYGDSGGPVLHKATGKALGIVSAFNFVDVPPTTDAGPTLAHIQAQLAARGYNVVLQTAPATGALV